MFGLFKKKTQLEKLIAKDGIEHSTARFAEIISRKLPTREIAYKFILEELDGASKGNPESKRFAEGSGIPAAEYRGALSNSDPDVDGPEGPQQQLLGLSLELVSNQALMAEFRCKVDENIMRRYGLGKYSSAAPKTRQASGKEQCIQETSKIKLGAAEILVNLVLEQGASVSRDDMRQLVENVSANIGDREIDKAGEKVLALSALTSVTAYSIDQGDIHMANVYFKCVNVALDRYVKGQMESFDGYQTGAIRTIMQGYSSVVKELVEANGNPAAA